jgi:hypothetical protein
MRNLEVDMVFLKETLEYFKHYKTRINLLGGEPGLITNLKEVVSLIKEYDNIILSILSNSLIRRKYPWVLKDKDILYIEHLVLDFREDEIEKLGNHDFFDKNENNNYNLIIKTPNYIKYKNKYDLANIYHNNTILKEYNSRSPEYAETKQSPELDRRICAAFPSVPVIDFEIKKIRHCSKKVINGSRQFDITKENIGKMMEFKLFEYESYCETCVEVIPIKSKEQMLDVLEVITL